MSDFAQTQATVDIARRLVHLTSLKSVYVVPVESIDRSSWADSTEQGSYFSANLGRQAAPFLTRELPNAISLKSVRRELPNAVRGPFHFIPDNKYPFRIGIAGGSTVFGLIEALEPLHAAPPQGCRITPLVVGPIPEALYSAAVLADMLQMRIPGSTIHRIARLTDAQGGSGINIELNPDCRKAAEEMRTRKEEVALLRREEQKLRDMTPMIADFGRSDSGTGERQEQEERVLKLRTTLANSLKAVGEELMFDWVITGIGSPNTSQLKAHLRLIYRDNQALPPKDFVGSIGSRLFNRLLGEMDAEKADRFVAVSFAWLRYLANERGRRVIAIAGGVSKLEALHTLLSCNPADRLLNVLITDELSARVLLRYLDGSY